MPSCFGGVRAKSKEVPPTFLVAGLGGAPVDEMWPLAQHLLANAVLLVPGTTGKQDMNSLAAGLVGQVLAQQPTGPFTLVARGWAGCVALEAARLLEARGDRVAVMLLDCAPQGIQSAVWGLGQAGGLQTWLLCSLLHLTAADYDALEVLPSWQERMQQALQLSDADNSKHREELRAGLDLVYSRLCTLAEYRTDYALHKTVITLLRPVSADSDDFCGLDKLSTLDVQIHVLDSPVGTPHFWKHAANIVSAGVYVGSKPMHLQVIGKCKAGDTLWQRLR